MSIANGGIANEPERRQQRIRGLNSPGKEASQRIAFQRLQSGNSQRGRQFGARRTRMSMVFGEHLQNLLRAHTLIALRDQPPGVDTKNVLGHRHFTGPPGKLAELALDLSILPNVPHGRRQQNRMRAFGPRLIDELPQVPTERVDHLHRAIWRRDLAHFLTNTG